MKTTSIDPAAAVELLKSRTDIPDTAVSEYADWLKDACRAVKAITFEGRKYLLVCYKKDWHEGPCEDVAGGVWFRAQDAENGTRNLEKLLEGFNEGDIPAVEGGFTITRELADRILQGDE